MSDPIFEVDAPEEDRSEDPEVVGVTDAARYTRVATGMIANVKSPLDLLRQPRKKSKKPRSKAQPTSSETDQPPA